MEANRSKTFQRLRDLVSTEKQTLGWGLFFLVISSAASLIYPQVSRWLVDKVLIPRDTALLGKVVLALLLAFVIQAITGSMRYYLFTLAGERIVLRLRQRLYQNILRQEVAFFDMHRTGELMSRLASDCTMLQNTVSVNISQGLRNVGQVIGGFGFMFYTSWKLSGLMFILVPPIAILASFFGKKIRALSKDFQTTIADASIVAEETISGVRTVKSFVQEANEVLRYRGALDRALDMAIKRIKTVGIFMTLAMILGFGAVAFVFWFGGLQVIDGSMTTGDLTQFLLYLIIVAIGVGSLGSLWGDLMSGIGASHRIFEIMEREAVHEDVGRTLESVNGRVEFKDVQFSYPSRPEYPVLQGVNMVIEPGQVVALVGSSGGGKTTVASLIPRFYDPLAGEILVDGVSIRDFKPSWLREQIGIVSQEPILISSTIEDNIRYGNPHATEADVVKAARLANVYDFAMKFPDGLKTMVGEKGIQLSGGQKQRVAIARALLKDPRILILDEATSNLDSESEHLVQEALQALMKNRTTIVIAHRLATVRDADRIFVIDAGRIAESGRHEELSTRANSVYYRLLQRQFE